MKTGACLQYDNARPHKICHAVKQIHNLKPQVLSYPPYLADLAPSDFSRFWPLKFAIRGCRFILGEKVACGGGGARFTGTATKKPLPPRNLCLSRTMTRGAVGWGTALHSEGCGFDSRWCHWNYSLTQSFQPHYDPGIDSASHRNECQEYFLRVKVAGA